MREIKNPLLECSCSGRNFRFVIKTVVLTSWPPSRLRLQYQTAWRPDSTSKSELSCFITHYFRGIRRPSLMFSLSGFYWCNGPSPIIGPLGGFRSKEPSGQYSERGWEDYTDGYFTLISILSMWNSRKSRLVYIYLPSNLLTHRHKIQCHWLLFDSENVLVLVIITKKRRRISVQKCCP